MHTAVEKLMQAASAINKRIHLVVGGFHLVVARDPDIEKATTLLRDT
jgi:7,8-dihydropterin-6-yl-methyl-4-(beta-D-ribofuranosyl)aminobenzene 5'-phosphate synthase